MRFVRERVIASARLFMCILGKQSRERKALQRRGMLLATRLVFEPTLFGTWWTRLVLRTAVWLGRTASRVSEWKGANHTRELMMLSTVGGLFMVQAEQREGFLPRWFGVELQAYTRFLLVGGFRQSVAATERSVKYLMLSRAGSRFLLLALLVSFQEAGVWGIVPTTESTVSSRFRWVCVFTGLRFKLGLRPFHPWSILVLSQTSISAAGFLATVGKLAVFDLFVSLMSVANDPTIVVYSAVRVAASVFVGSVGAVGERSMLRLLAFSGVRHAGYFVVPTLSTDATRRMARRWYRLVYRTTAGLGWLILVSYPNAYYVGGFSRLSQRRLKVRMTIVVFSLAGIPPFIGFGRKAQIVKEALVRFPDITCATMFVRLVLACSAVGILYSLRLARALWFEDRARQVPVRAVIARQVEASRTSPFRFGARRLIATRIPFVIFGLHGRFTAMTF